MDIKEYRYILEIASAGGISKAANNLHISQPSLSEYLRNIEDRVGLRLFQTSRTGITLTHAGEVYVEHARQIMGMDHSLMESLEGIKENKSGKVRIGIPGTASTILVPKLKKLLQEKYPEVETVFVEAISSQLEDMAVNKRSLDMILASKPLKSPLLETQKLFEEQFVVILPKTFAPLVHPKVEAGLKYPYLEAEELKDLPFTLLKPGQKLRELADSFFLEHGLTPNIIHETSSSTTAFNMVKEGLCGMFSYDSYIKVKKLDQDVDMYLTGRTPVTLHFVAAYMPEAMEVGTNRMILDEMVGSVREVSETMLA